MITRTTIGADFERALSYGAGLTQRGAAKKAELIGSSNLGDVGNPRGMAAEMRAVAEENTKCKNPVWHTSLSWAEGEQVSTAQKLKAAERYCEIIGANWDAHQVAVFEHHDTKHAHIHLYFNRVPVYGGPAIDTGHNYARNLKAIKLITQELGLTPLPAQRQSVRDSRPPVQDTRQKVRGALVEALANPQLQSIEQLREHLTAKGIEMQTKRSQAGQLVGVSFKQGEAAVTGQEVGMKAAQLREHYEPAQRQAQVPQPVATDVVQRLEQLMAEQLRQHPQAIPFLEALSKHGFLFKLKPNQVGPGRVGVFVEQASGVEVPSLTPKPGGRPWTDQVQAPARQQLAAPRVPEVARPRSPGQQPAAPEPQPVASIQGGPVAAPQPPAPAQRPVAAQPPAPELKPALKPEPPEPETPRPRVRIKR